MSNIAMVPMTVFDKTKLSPRLFMHFSGAHPGLGTWYYSTRRNIGSTTQLLPAEVTVMDLFTMAFLLSIYQKVPKEVRKIVAWYTFSRSDFLAQYLQQLSDAFKNSEIKWYRNFQGSQFQLQRSIWLLRMRYSTYLHVNQIQNENYGRRQIGIITSTYVWLVEPGITRKPIFIHTPDAQILHLI